jgi:hypothetical protein
MPRSDKIFRPHTMSGRVLTHRKRIMGGGNAILLQTGGPGAGSSYDSLAQYKEITGNGVGGRVRPPPPSRDVPVSGIGLGGAIERSLQQLTLKPEPKQYRKKPQNISFSI